MATTVLLFSVLALCSLSGIRAHGCTVNNTRSTSFSFSILSRKNQTGHWVAEVKLGPEITDNKHNGGWQIEITKNIVDNNGLQPIVSITATLTAPVPIAAPGYELFPKIGYYKLHTEGKTWEAAKAACAGEGAHLAVIYSEAESDVVKQLLARYPNLGGPNMVAHIGFNDMVTEGEYVTIVGEPLAATGFTRWSTIGSQPDDAGPGEDCGSVHRNGGLNDIACDTKAPFLCKQDLYPPSNVNTNTDKTVVVEGGVTSVEGATKDVAAAGGETNVEGVSADGVKGTASGGDSAVPGGGGGEKKDEGATGGGDRGQGVEVETGGKDKNNGKGQGVTDGKDESEEEDPDRIVFEEPIN